MQVVNVWHRNHKGDESKIGDTTNRTLQEIISMVSEGICPCNIYWHNEHSVVTRRRWYDEGFGVRADQLLPHLDAGGICPFCKCSWIVKGDFQDE